MFDEVLKQIEDKLDIPYPERTLLVRELEADLWSHFSALREAGFEEAEARDAALRELGLDEANLASLADLHNPVLRKLLLRLPKPVRQPAEWLAAGLSLLAGILFIIKEVPMLNFMREGGFAMWVILIVGGGALLLQLRCLLSWFILRDHSPRSLARNTPTPLYLALASFLLGVTGSGVGFYYVMLKFTQGAFGSDVMVVGFVEALSPIIFGGVLAVFIVLVHTALSAGVRGLQHTQPT